MSTIARAFVNLLISSFFVLSFAAEAPGTSVNDLEPVGFERQFNLDISYLKSYIENIEKTLDIIEKDKDLFNITRTRDFNIQEKQKLYGLWGNYLDYMVALEDLTGYYRNFFLLKRAEQQRKAFLIAYCSYLAKFSFGLRFISRTIDNELYEKKLDDKNTYYGIPSGMYARLKWNTIHVQDVTTALAGYQYYRFLRKSFTNSGLIKDERTIWIFNRIESDYAYIKKELKFKGLKYFVANGLDILKDRAFAAWFPAQAGISRVMGDIKVKRLNRYLITVEQIHKMNPFMKPGDIIVERRNWFLSNAGLPGFWPHAELYIGTYRDMKAFFDNDSVTSYYRSLGQYDDFMDYLEKKYPLKMKEFLKKAADGYPHQLIEAVSEGVKFSSIEEGASADYIGVMRPRLSRLDIAKAVDEAFRALGRPYDFNFDFLTDSSLVCSELIYKIYLNGVNKRGLNLPLREIAGRKIISPNDIVRKFDSEFGTPQQELDFVYFLDGSERQDKAVVRGLADFRHSHERLKWDIVQK